jgi:hypothetical protein
MNIIEVIGHVDEQHRLHADLPADVTPGPVKIIVRPVTEQDEEDDWRALINHAWARDWSDPREDIYTLEDGTPSHDPR